MHDYDATFSLNVTNINAEPMTKIVITDGPFDSRHYLKRLYGGSALLNGNIDKIYGVKSDGSKVEITGMNNASQNGFSSKIMDQAVYDQIAGYVAQVKAGTMNEADVPAVPSTYTSLEIHLKEDFALQPGQSFSFLVGLGYTDPYHLTIAQPETTPENQAKNTLKNDAKLTGKLGTADFLGTGASSNRLLKMNESFGITKTTQNNKTGTIGEELVYPINFQNALGKARQFNNARIIDVLPQGVTYRSTYPKLPRDPAKEDFTVVDNFMGSGRQAIIYSLGNILASELPSKNFNLYATINDKATPADFHTAVEDNMNYVYFTADNWKTIPEGVKVDTLLPDVLNLNENGTDQKILGSKSTFTALLPTDVTGVKHVRAGTEGEWSLQPVFVNYDSPYQYKLSIRNNENNTLSEATIYDILPFSGDTYYNYDGEDYPDRGSAFSGLMTGPIIAPPGFTVMYRTDSYMPPNPDAGINDSQAWKTEAQIGTNWERVRGFKIQTNPGTEIPPYSTTEFIVNMKTRSYVLENNFNNQTSNNLFAVRYNNRGFGQSNLVSIHLSQAFNVTKVWNGGHPEDRDQEVHVQLYRDGAIMPGRTIALSQGNNWEAAFGDLPVYSPFGKLYTYTVEEVNTPPNYQSKVEGNQVDGFTITNTYESSTLNIKGSKIWDGGPNTDDYQVALQLYRWIGDGDYTNGPDGADPKDEFNADGLIAKEAVGNVHYVNKDNAWTSSKDNPRYNNEGIEYNYVIREVRTPFSKWDNPEYYEQSINESLDKNGNLQYGTKQYDEEGNLLGWSFEVTNKYRSPIKDLLTSKVWVGGDYSYPRILIDLYRYKQGQDPLDAEKVVDGISSATTNVSPYHIYKDMPLNDETDGVPYIYRIEEVDLSKLTPEEMVARNITQADIDEYANYISMRNFAQDPLGVNDPNTSIINEYVSPRLIVEGTKTWVGGDDGNRPEIKLQLMQNGEKYVPKPTLTGTGVPGSLISVNIGTPANYTTLVHPDGKWYLEFAADVAENTTFTVTQTESGKTPSDPVTSVGGAQVAAGQLSNGQSATPGVNSFETLANPITITGTDVASWNVPRTDFFEQDYHYQVIEVDVPENYTDSYSEAVEERDAKDKLTKLTQEVINTYTPDTIEIKGNKEWNGGPDKKPGFELQLYRITGDDEGTKTAVGAPVALLTESSHTWNVPEKDGDGVLYHYFIEESTAPENYTASYKMENGVEDKLTIVNTFTPEPISVPVQKSWVGGNLADRPENIVVGLYIGDNLGKDSEGNNLEITLDADGQWKGDFKNVPTIDENLNPIEYTIKENAPDGFKFSPSYEGDQTRGFRITNTYIVDQADVTATKVWVGGENIIGRITRPPVQLQLFRNLLPVGDPVWVDGIEDGNELTPWNYTWKDLPVQDMTGTDYIYTIQEVNIPKHFVADHDGLTVTNIYSPALTDFTAKKEWKGGPENHPTAVFQLYRALVTTQEKEAVGDLIFVKDDIHTWKDLPTTNAEGVAYSYWVEESNIPDDYTATRGEVIGNTQTITNTYKVSKGNITGYKKWVGGPAEKPEITLILERQITPTGAKEVVAEQVLSNGDVDALWENMDLSDENGNPYIFSVREKEVPANYNVTYSDMTVTNTYAIPKEGVVEATKIWEGGPAENRPVVYFDLYRQIGNGEATRVPNTDNKEVVTADGETSAKVRWENLETKDANGNDYIFTVKEVGTPTGYTKAESGLSVTNTYQVSNTKFTATKKWVGGPTDKPVISLQLKQRLETAPEDQGINYGPAIALEGTSTNYQWTDLPKTDSNGVPYIYSVDETTVPKGYQKSLSEVSYNLFGEGRQTITNTMETKEINFKKSWVGGPDTKPTVTIGVRVNGEQITDINGKVIADIKLNNGQTTGSFKDLPVYDENGAEIQYDILETDIGGVPVENGKAGNYDVQIMGAEITNTFVPEKTTLHVEKKWEGGSEESQTPVEIQLFRQAPGENKEFVGEAVTLEEARGWKHQWTDLDLTNQKGQIYNYTVDELTVPNSYRKEIQGKGTTEDPFVVTNTYTTEKTEITAFKKWIGGPLEKPEVELSLYRKTEGMQEPELVPAGLPLIGLQNPITLANGEISYTWKNLPVNDDEGNLYSYSVVENKIGGTLVENNEALDYKVSYEGMVVTNSYKSEEIKISAEKVWVGGEETTHTAPEFILYQNGQIYTESIATITPGEGTSNTFNYEWTVPKTDEFGQDYLYTVDEVQTPEGYGKSIKVDEGTGKTTITNTFDAKVTDISVHKDWIGGSDYPAITFELQRRVGNDEFVTVATEVLPTGDHIHIWKDQALTNDQNQDYEYRVRETKIGDTEVVEDKALTHSVSYSGTVAEGFTVTNTSDNALEIPITKVWVDDDNAKETRPTKITFTAVREDGVKKSQVFDVNEENKYVIEGLEKYKPNSTEEYKYTIEEVQMGDYQATVDGTTVTNTLQKTTEINFKKTWIGGPDTKPEVTINLQRNGEQAVTVEGKEVEPIILTEGQTTGSFKDLPVYDENGAEIQYDILETHIDGVPVENEKAGNYEVKIEGNTITNTFVMDEISFTGEKAWGEGPEDRPEVGFQLYRRLENEAEDLKKAVGPPVAIKGEGYTWEKLPRANENNVKYVYSVDEPNVPAGYEKSIQDPVFDNLGNGSQTIKNTFIIEEGTVTATKRWVDGNAEDHKAVELTLYQNGTEMTVDPDIIDNGDSTFSYTWNVPTTDPQGKAYIYTVDELEVPENYRKTRDGMTITNTYYAPEITINVSKTWIGGLLNRAPMELQLYRETIGGEKVAVEGLKLITDGDANVSWTVASTDAEGNPYKYTVNEIKVPENFNASYSEDGLKVTNTYTSPKTEIKATKVWDGGPEEKPIVQLQLQRNGEDYGEVITLEETNVHTWKDLDLTDGDGHPYNYTVRELKIDHYDSIITETVDEGILITNSYTTEVIDFTVTKEWDDGPALKPTVGIQLYRRLVTEEAAVKHPFGPRIVLDNDNLSYTWEKLPKTNPDGVEYIYSVDEPEVPAGYLKSIGEVKDNVQIIKNTFQVNERQIEAIKKWIGGNLADHVEVDLTLYQNDQAVEIMPTVEKVEGSETEYKYTWTVPSTDEQGEVYNYRVEEEVVPTNYVKTQVGNQITNTFAVSNMTINVSKTWIGGLFNREPVEIQLYRKVEGGELEKVEGMKLLTDGDVTVTWTVPRTNEKGEQYLYSVNEVNVPANFNESYSDDGLKVTNTYISPKKSLEVTKVWDGGPEEKPAVFLQLMKNGQKEGEKITLDPETNTHIWQDLDINDQNGVAYKYSVVEDPMDLYKPVITENENGFTITNHYTTDTGEVTGVKKWVGEPEDKPAIDLVLLQNNEPYQAEGILNPRTVSKSSNWTTTWTNLPITDKDGKEYLYSVDEVETPKGYEKSYGDDGRTVINTYLQELTDIKATKEWVGGPKDKPNVELQLMRDGVAVGDPVPLTDTNSHTWEDQPVQDENGKAYIYSVTEVAVPEGYQLEVKGNIQTGFTLTNTFEKTTEITIEKIWKDENANTRPDILIFMAVRNDGEIIRKVFDRNNMDKYIIDGLAIYDENGEEYSYQVDEATVPGYAKSIEGNTITNTLTDKTDINVRKIWKGVDNPADYKGTFQLYANDQLVEGKTLEINGDGTGAFKDLDAFDKEGAPIRYDVKEILIPDGFETEKVENGICGCDYVFTNTLTTEKMDLSVEKEWVGEDETRPSITLRLMDGNNQVAFVVLEPGQTKYTFSNLEKYRKDGSEITYTLREDPVEGYTSKIEGLKVTNTKIEAPVIEPETVDVKGEKVWIGGEAEKPTIQLQLMQNGKAFKEPVNLTNGNTEYLWTGLPKLDDAGKAYKYTVDEVAVPEGYEKVPYEGTVVINKAKTEEPTLETTTVVGTKIWINTTGERPEVQLQLKRNGSNYLDPVTLKDGASEAIWKDLPLKDEKNDLYNYTVDEITVPAGYTKEVINGRIIVNTKTEEPVTETINFTGNKIWLGGPVAKPNIELILLQNGVKIGESVVLKSGENAATWNDLPRLDESGAPYKYSVDEKSVPTDYKKILYPSIPNTVFNEYQKSEEPSVTENISIKGTKVWLDGPKDKPDIQLILLRNGVKVGEAVSLTKGQTVYEWINLPKTDEKGKDYVYTVDEVNVPQGYEKILAGTTVINKYKSVEEPKDLIDITGKKVWVGGPEEKPAIQLQLKQNGKNYGEPVTLDGKTEHKWTNLPKKDAEGKDYSYTVDEVEVPKDYTKKVSGMTVTNTHDSIEETTDLIDITGKKVWVGGPEEKPVIQLQLKQNDKNYGEPVTLDGKTEHKWTNLPKKDAEGKEYSYTVDEVEVPKDYTKKVSGTTVTNTHKTVKESNATNNVVNRGSNTRYQPVSSGGYGQSKPAYYPAEIPKTSDPMVFWGLMSGALAVLLGTTTIIAKKKEEKDE